MNKSKITNINIQSTSKANHQKTSLSSNLLYSNNLPISKSTNHIEHYEFTTPLNTIEKCKDSSISSNDYSNGYSNAQPNSNKNDKESKKVYLNDETNEMNRDTNDKSASEFASYTEPCKMSNDDNLQNLQPNRSSELSSDSMSSNHNKVSIASNKMQRRRKLPSNKNCLICSTTAQQPQCPFNPQRQQCLIKPSRIEQNKDDEQFKLSNKCEFFLFCIGSSLNLGNTWRFPYLCYRYNGGTFLIAYFVCSLVLGFPLLLIELTLGQYSKMNSVNLFKNLVPILKGLSNITVVCSIVTTIYFNLILSWTLIYLYESLFRGMRFKRCDSLYSSTNCTNLESIKYNMINRTSFVVISSEDFFNNQILNKSSNEDQLIKINWTVLLALLATWLILFIFLSLNIRHTGRLIYFIAIFPYLIFFLVFIKCITLNNAADGLIFYIVPNLNKLTFELWKDAAVQVFFSFGLTSGSLLTYASYNKFYNPVLNHATLVLSINILASLFICFIMFSILGFYSSILRRPVNSVLSSAIGLLFIVIPDQLASSMSWPILWTSFYFLILFIIGLNTQLASLEVICTYLNNLMDNKKRILNYFILCLILFILNLPFAMKSGAYLLELTDYYFNGLIYLSLAFGEFIIVAYIFGVSNFFDLLKTMKCFNPKLLIKSHLTVLISTICPLALAYLINIAVIQIVNIKDKNIFSHSNRLTDLFCYALWSFILINLAILILASFHYIFIQKLDNKLISSANQKLSIWIKIRFGFESNLNLKKNSIKSMNCFKTKNLSIIGKKHQSNCNLHPHKSKQLFKHKDSIIIF